jgi:hypothetical protein
VLTVPQLPLVTEQWYESEEVKLPGEYVLFVPPLIEPAVLYH